MVLRAKVLGREALMKRLRQIAPDAERKAEVAKLEVVNDAASKIAAKAPRSPGGGKYAASIRGGYQRDSVGLTSFGGKASKDPDATGVYGDYIWRFLEFGTAASTKGHRVGARSTDVNQHKSEGRFARRTHPGTAAQPHIFPTWRSLKPAARKKINAAINKAVRKAMGK